MSASYVKPTEVPSEPTTEEPTEEPTEVPTEKPTEAQTQTPTEAPTASAESGDGVQTGDTSRMPMYMTLLAAAMAMLAGVAVKEKKTK